MKIYRIARTIRTGWHGVCGAGCDSRGTEGMGMYVSHAQYGAEFMAETVEKVTYYEPSNPLMVVKEPLYILNEDRRIFNPISESDSAWTKINKQAAINMKDGGFRKRAQLCRELTRLIKLNGYDCVRVLFCDQDYVSGAMSWDVLLDPSLIISVGKAQEPTEEDDKIDNWFLKANPTFWTGQDEQDAQNPIFLEKDDKKETPQKP